MVESVLPTGTVSFVFTDVEGSTKLLVADRAATGRVLDRHHELLADAVRRNGGVVFETVGDGVYAAFATAPAACRAAVAMQQAIVTEPWTTPTPLRIRIAVHSGTVENKGERYFGAALFECARLQAQAHGGQTVMSDVTRELAAGRLPPDATLSDLGRHRLKDLAEPMHVWQLSASGLRDTFPPLRSTVAAPTNVVPPLTTFVGRQPDLEQVGRLLEQQRLVTILGTGGTGKTRLSVEVALATLGRYRDGVFAVELAALRDPRNIADAIAKVLHVVPDPTTPVEGSVRQFLADREMLLVLDNWEHVIAGAGLVSTLLEAAPGVRVLATSRVPLNLRGEHRYPLAPLALPEPGAGESADRPAAVELFLARARSVDPSFKPDASAILDIGAICRHLDGLPLAIELAAARVGAAPVGVIRRTLVDRHGRLATQSADVPERQRSLHDTVDWSVALLRDVDQRLFRRLGVFTGSFSLAAVDEVVAVDGPNAGEPDRFESLLALTEASLLLPRPDPSGDARYTMLETIREQATARITGSGEETALRERHAAWYAGVAERGEHGLHGADALMWSRLLDLDLPNIRAALEWSIGARRGEIAGRIAGCMWRYWFMRAAHSEAIPLARRALATDPPPRWRAKTLNCLGVLHQGAGGAYTEARTCFLAARELASDLPDAELADVTNNLGLNDWSAGDTKSAVELFNESLRLWRATGDTRGEAVPTGNLSDLLMERGDLTGAIEMARRAVELAAQAGAVRAMAETEINLAPMLIADDRWAEAEPLITRAIVTMHGLGDRAYLPGCLERAASVWLRREPADFVGAARLLGAATGIRRRLRLSVDRIDDILRRRVLDEGRSFEGWQRAFEEGEALDLDAAVRYALGSDDPFRYLPAADAAAAPSLAV